MLPPAPAPFGTPAAIPGLVYRFRRVAALFNGSDCKVGGDCCGLCARRYQTIMPLAPMSTHTGYRLCRHRQATVRHICMALTTRRDTLGIPDAQESSHISSCQASGFPSEDQQDDAQVVMPQYVPRVRPAPGMRWRQPGDAPPRLAAPAAPLAAASPAAAAARPASAAAP